LAVLRESPTPLSDVDVAVYLDCDNHAEARFDIIGERRRLSFVPQPTPLKKYSRLELLNSLKLSL